MSEEIIKNYPGSGGYTAAEVNAQGAFASGNVGGVTSPGLSTLGNIPTAQFGVTTGSNAVTPSYDANPTFAGAGILRPEQARRFIEYVWDGTVLAKDGRRVTMRVIRAANQGDPTYTNAGATFTKVELTTKKIRLDWEVSSEALEDNIEGAALEDHLVRLMTQAFANDIEDLAINGTGTGANNFLNIMEGFISRTKTDGWAHEYVATVSNNAFTPEVLQQVVDRLPRKYRALKTGLKFYAGTSAFQGIVRNNGTAANNVWSYEYRNAYLDGNNQVLGDARTTRVLGIPVMEVPYYPEGFVDLTFPSNRIWGFQRDITVNRFYVPKKDTIEYTVFVRFGIQWEEQDAIAYVDSDSIDSSL